MSDLIDTDGENRAVRAFLLLYGGSAGVTTTQMRRHMEASGSPLWPEWAAHADRHLTKGGAQDWLRHLFALEASAQPAITPETGSAPPQRASAITSESVQAVPLLSDEEAQACIPTVTLKGEKPVPMVWLKQADAITAIRSAEQAVRAKLGAGVGWIACEDQMPEPGTECLVRVKVLSPKQNGPTHYTHIDTWDEQHEAPVSWSSATVPIGFGWGSFDFEDVTHWQPLPPPPGIVGKEGA